jgi:hypothetical protein
MRPATIRPETSSVPPLRLTRRSGAERASLRDAFRVSKELEERLAADWQEVRAQARHASGVKRNERASLRAAFRVGSAWSAIP